MMRPGAQMKEVSAVWGWKGSSLGGQPSYLVWLTCEWIKVTRKVVDRERRS